MNVLLVEPNVELKYFNLALLKLSAKHKLQGDTTAYIKGNSTSLPFEPDIIYVSTVFTYYAGAYIDTINFYKNAYPNAKLEVGGVFATLMPDYIEERTGIKPFIGYSEELDATKPDYSIYPQMISYYPYLKRWEDFSITCTMRGCPRHCAFCAVKRLEPNVKIVPNWKDAVDLSKKRIMVQDNNLTYAPMEHFEDVINFIIKHKLSACFNSGFDARLITEEQMQLLSKVKWYPNGLRMAFDNMGEDQFIQKAVKRLLELKVPRSAFMIFCMFNFHDTVEEANYRMREMSNLGVRPYPQVYVPLDSTNKKEIYVDPNWTLEEIRMVRKYWFLRGISKYQTYEQYVEQVRSKRKRRKKEQ